MAHEKGSINVSVANLYKEPIYQSEILTQGLLCENVDILEHENEFIRICQTDGYESWISSYQISEQLCTTGKQVVVRKHFLTIYKDKKMSHPLKDAVIGCHLIAVDEDETFYRIFLPTGELGWAKKKYFGTFPDFSADAVINLAREFLGYQYFWGGKTPKGFDCSGFVQSVFSLLGKQISRDAGMQAKEGFHLSNTWHGAHASDLLFFGSSKDEISHVGISLGNNKFIHALGWVRINSLSEADSEFSRKHVKTFIHTQQIME